MTRRVSLRWFTTVPKFGDSLREEFMNRVKQSASLPHVRFNVKEVPKDGNSAVLVPLVNIRSEPWLLFTQRSLLLTGHRGQVCFPGGRIEPGETPEETALRESAEEIGLGSQNVKVWGHLRAVYTRNLLNIVTPVVGMLHDVDLTALKVQSDEVRSIFAVSVEELCSCHGYTFFKRLDGARYILPVFRCHNFQMISSSFLPLIEYRIWGLTAAILHLALLHLFPSLYKSDIKILHPPPHMDHDAS